MAPAALTIEPTFLAFDPIVLESAKELEVRIQTLLAASKLLRGQGTLHVLLPGDTASLLGEAGHYPIFDQIEGLLASSGLSHVYSAEDVVRVFNQLVQRCRTMEEYTGIRYALYAGEVTVVPELKDVYSSDQLGELFVRILAHLAAAIAVNERLRRGLGVLTPMARKANVVSVSGDLIAVEPEMAAFDAGHISVPISVSNSLKGMLLSLDGYEIWRTSGDSESLTFGLMIGALKYGLKNRLFSDIQDIPKFSVGSDFLQSLIENQGIGNGQFCSMVYEHTVSVICRKSGDRMRDRSRDDGAVAMRLHLTTKHEALRLMYWLKQDSIELANIGPKFELKISRGDGRPVELHSTLVL